MTASPVDILLVEDNPSDVALTLHALRSTIWPTASRCCAMEPRRWSFCLAPEPMRSAISPEGHGVVLLDLKLPLVSGLEVLRRLKADPRTQPIPVVMLHPRARIAT